MATQGVHSHPNQWRKSHLNNQSLVVRPKFSHFIGVKLLWGRDKSMFCLEVR